MKAGTGWGFIIMPACASPPMAFWWPSGAFSPPQPQRGRVKSDWDYPACPADSTPADLPLRPERHRPDSIATLRRSIATHLARSCLVVPVACAAFYNTVVLGADMSGLLASRIDARGKVPSFFKQCDKTQFSPLLQKRCSQSRQRSNALCCLEVCTTDFFVTRHGFWFFVPSSRRIL